MFNMSLRIARTWGFVKKEGPAGPPQGGPGPGPGGPPFGPGGPIGPGGAVPKKYNLTFSLFAINPLNHPNFAAPNGNLSSPFFGQPLSLQTGFGPGGNSTYNRKITMQMNFNF